MNDKITLIAFNYLPEATLAKNFLETNEIDVLLKDELSAQLYPIATGGVKLLVKNEDAGKALELLKEGGYIQ
ncbi:MAG: DUF2007 domain-containing protein [Candidatus Azobacteroides sp.]|nr:DUF2007 domain-containing protein [Candidatus Azobacteroides sp.]